MDTHRQPIWKITLHLTIDFPIQTLHC